jgi:hypothetical protein
MYKIIWAVYNANDSLVNAYTSKAECDRLMRATSTLKVKVENDKTKIWQILHRLGKA